jgi:uncharacterized protein YbjT (DUF2867 family)
MTNAQDSSRVILVAGATGKQGGATARNLLKQGFKVRALTRDPNKPTARALADEGAEVVQGDMDERAAMQHALEGVYGVFSVQNFWEVGYDREVREGKTLADASKAANIRHFVYSSVASAHRKTGLSHFESKWNVEEHIRRAGLPYTIIRPVWFMQNWQNWREWILKGMLSLPLSPSTNFQQINVDDIGAIAALAFSNPDKWLGRELDIAGDEHPMTGVVDTFSRVLNRPVQYAQMPWDQFKAQAGEEYEKMFRWFENVGYDADIAALRKEYPKLSTFEQFLRSSRW